MTAPKENFTGLKTIPPWWGNEKSCGSGEPGAVTSANGFADQHPLQPLLVNVTIPVFNEQSRLSESIPKLHRFLSERCRFNFEIIIADNGSTDRTLDIARGFSHAYSEVRVVHVDLKGRGRAIKKVWSESRAEILSYMDVDLSTDLCVSDIDRGAV